MLSPSPRPFLLPGFILVLLAALPSGLRADEGLATHHHDLQVTVDPARHRFVAVDRISFENEWDDIRFFLHEGLEAKGEGVTVTPLGRPDLRRYGINGEGTAFSGVPLREYRLQRGDHVGPVVIRYEGEIHHPLGGSEQEYARGFSGTPGSISDEGIFLAGSSAWVPTFGTDLFTFRLTVDLPEGWMAVSQGRLAADERSGGRRRVEWDCPHAMEEIYLCGAEFTEYSRPAGSVQARVYLRTPDDNLANQYLEVTAQYLQMYGKLLGPYPFEKFALVENFWETGYGMPSFTLLGSKVIRFPFILHSSYPHEILHNWWGNSVYVDYESGNWCEGLTAYMADYLTKEGQGRGREYRRDTLKKYRSFARGSRDFALKDFRSRHDPATEAVGYGKSLMVWHMLRRRVGDDLFRQGLRRFYSRHRFQRASFSDMEKTFSEVTGKDLSGFFRQWTVRPGAPRFRLRVQGGFFEGGRRVTARITQENVTAGTWDVEMPVVISAEGESEPTLLVVPIHKGEGEFEVPLGDGLVRVDVDPDFDIFREVYREEIPSSVGEIFGADRLTIVRPESSEEHDWDALAQGLAAAASGDVVIATLAPGSHGESFIESDRAVWFLGAPPPARATLDTTLDRFGGSRGGDGYFSFGEQKAPRDDHSFVVTSVHPRNPDLAIGWIEVGNPAAIPGLVRKLPHYGRYSYLAFQGEEPTNVVKGQWPAAGSPLSWVYQAGQLEMLPRPSREPLARLEPVFDGAAMRAIVERLAADAMEGRGVGSEGLDRAAELIAGAFEEAGLEPGADDGTFFQSWSEPDGPDGETVTLKNVIGVLAGKNPDWKKESVVLAAHYDHLGRGWPDVRTGFEGQIHNGADDNASGVAVMLEVAKNLRSTFEPSRPIVCVAFSGEEWDLRGSRRFVEKYARHPAAEALAMINLDSVGRLEGKKITLFGAGSADEWIHIARGIGFTTGVESNAVLDQLGASDHSSFHSAGVPAVHVFTGAHEDYHRPTDDVEKIDVDGLVKVATWVREAVMYLAERDRPLTSRLERRREGAGGTPAPAAGGGDAESASAPSRTSPSAGPGSGWRR